MSEEIKLGPYKLDKPNEKLDVYKQETSVPYISPRDQQILDDEWASTNYVYANGNRPMIDNRFQDGVDWADCHPVSQKFGEGMVNIVLKESQLSLIIDALKSYTPIEDNEYNYVDVQKVDESCGLANELEWLLEDK